MSYLSKPSYMPNFSHIYIEKRVFEHPNTKTILNKFKNSKIILINHYKDVFNRSKQNFTLQKNSKKLILALKESPYIYKGAQVCQSFDNNYFYYTSTMMNCVYNCEYCYLQGMYPSANIVLFVNIEDIFLNIKNILKQHPMYVCISYDTDLLAFEKIFNFSRMWIEFTKRYKDLTIEIRTKSANFSSISHIRPQDNIILAWTLSPDNNIELYEKNTPTLNRRINDIINAIKMGWNVRLCFDPLIYTHDWFNLYSEFIDYVFNKIPYDKIIDVSVGVFRVGKDYLKRMQKQRQLSRLLSYPFENKNGVCTYGDKITKQMENAVVKMITKYIDKDKIFLDCNNEVDCCEENSTC